LNQLVEDPVEEPHLELLEDPVELAETVETVDQEILLQQLPLKVMTEAVDQEMDTQDQVEAEQDQLVEIVILQLVVQVNQVQ
jgi:hypothetical protein